MTIIMGLCYIHRFYDLHHNSKKLPSTDTIVLRILVCCIFVCRTFVRRTFMRRIVADPSHRGDVITA